MCWLSTQGQSWSVGHGNFVSGVGDAEIGRNIDFVNDSLYITFTDSYNNFIPGSGFGVSNIDLVDGSLIWTKTYSRDTTLFASAGNNHLDYSPVLNQFVAASNFETRDPESGNHLYLLKQMFFDENLDTLYTTQVGDSINFYRASQARYTLDGGSIMVGWWHDIPLQTPQDILLVKFDGNGMIEWEKIYGSSVMADLGYSVVPLSNGNYAVGSTSSYLSTFEPSRPIISLLDSEGSFIAQRDFELGEYDELWANLNLTSDGNMISCFKEREEWAETDFVFMKLDTALNTIWETKLEMHTRMARIDQIKETSDGGFVSVGTYIDPDTAYEYGVMVKLDAEGELEWERRYQQSDTTGWLQVNNLYDVTEITSGTGGYAACGQVQANGTGQDYWVLRVDDKGCLVAGCDTITSINEISDIDELSLSIGPNPASDYLNVFIPEITSKVSGLSLQIRNAEGKLVEQLEIPAFNSTYILDVSAHARGVYTISLAQSSGKQLATKKLILN